MLAANGDMRPRSAECTCAARIWLQARRLDCLAGIRVRARVDMITTNGGGGGGVIIVVSVVATYGSHVCNMFARTWPPLGFRFIMFASRLACAGPEES